ncbi:5280_t:CDS:2, partial [Dentiscutata erythropus]
VPIDFVEWIPYEQFKRVKLIGSGGFGIIYSAFWNEGPISMRADKFERTGEFSDGMTYISDFGLSDSYDPENSTTSKCYGIIQFIAPELLKDGIYSPETDVYSFGIIMWMLSSGIMPNHSYGHDNMESRPRIIDGTPHCFEELMKHKLQNVQEIECTNPLDNNNSGINQTLVSNNNQDSNVESLVIDENM